MVVVLLIYFLLITVDAADFSDFIRVNTWAKILVADVDQSVWFATNYGLCSGSVLLGIPECTGVQLKVSLINGTVIGTTPMINGTTCTGLYNLSNRPTEDDWTEFELEFNFEGAHVLVIETLTGDAGTAIGVKFSTSSDCQSPFCTAGSGNIMFLQTIYPSDIIMSKICAEYSMQVARVTSLNFLEAVDVLFSCGGSGSKAYIQSWNGDSYQGTTLAIDAPWATPIGGAITVPAGGALINQLCMRRI